jgi:nucleoside-diphosphate-sugar epimerase
VKVFVLGATGVLGIRVVRLLGEAGHEVAGTTRSAARADAMRAAGAEPVVCDVYDAAALECATKAFGPAAVLNLLTDLPDDVARLDDFTAANNRIRREGARNVLHAARASGAGTLVVESVAWRLDGDAGAAVDELEAMTLEAGGVVVRYGRFYGPGTYSGEEPPDPPRIHVDEAARRTLPALDAPSGVVVVAEDAP